MKILQIIDSLTWGGAQKMVVHLTRSLRTYGAEIAVVNLRHPPNPIIEKTLLDAGAKIYTFPFPKLFSPVSFIGILGLVRRERFDLIQTYLAYSNIVGGLAGWMARIPVIGSLRSTSDSPQERSRKREVLDNFSLKYFCSRVLANGYAVAEAGKSRLGDTRIDVIPNAVDLIEPLPTGERQKMRMEIVGDLEGPIILSVGRMDYRKGFPDLINGFAKISSLYPSSALVIAGGGGLFDELTKQVSEMNLGGRVFLLGSRDDVQKLLGIADIYVNSSNSEGMPVSVLEAMSLGLPVIATSVGDTPYVVKPGTGVLIPPGEPGQIAQALKRLMDSPEECLKLGGAAREHIMHRHGLHAWVNQMIDLYSQIVPHVTDTLTR